MDVVESFSEMEFLYLHIQDLFFVEDLARYETFQVAIVYLHSFHGSEIYSVDWPIMKRRLTQHPIDSLTANNNHPKGWGGV